MMQDYLKKNNVSVKSGTDMNAIMREMMSVILEGVRNVELNEELGYSKYDYRKKVTDNSRNGHFKRRYIPYMDVSTPRDHNGDYEPQLVKKYQTILTLPIPEGRGFLSDERTVHF